MNVLDSANIVDKVLPVIHGLTEGDWFTSRISACGLIPVAYSRVSDEQAKSDLRKYVSLCPLHYSRAPPSTVGAARTLIN